MTFEILWTLWLLALIASFALFEGAALYSHGLTLSSYVWGLTEAWPPLPYVAGMVSGGLAVHFWWHWLPPGSISHG